MKCLACQTHGDRPGCTHFVMVGALAFECVNSSFHAGGLDEMDEFTKALAGIFDASPEEVTQPSIKVYARCPVCAKEISPTLDAFYGTDWWIGAHCSPCRWKKFQCR